MDFNTPLAAAVAKTSVELTQQTMSIAGNSKQYPSFEYFPKVFLSLLHQLGRGNIE